MARIGAVLVALAFSACGDGGGDGESVARTAPAQTQEMGGEGGGGEKAPGDVQREAEGQKRDGSKGADGAERGAKTGAESGAKPARPGGKGEGAGAGSEAGGAPEGRGELIRQADAICARRSAALEEEVGAYVGRAGLRNLGEQGPDLTEQVVIPALQAEIRELQALGGAGVEGEAIDAVSAALGGVIDEARADPRKFVLADDPYVESKRISRAYGFKRCGGI